MDESVYKASFWVVATVATPLTAAQNVNMQASHDRHENAVSAILEQLPLMHPKSSPQRTDPIVGQNLTTIIMEGSFSTPNAQQALGSLRLCLDSTWQKVNSILGGSASI